MTNKIGKLLYKPYQIYQTPKCPTNMTDLGINDHPSPASNDQG